MSLIPFYERTCACCDGDLGQRVTVVDRERDGRVVLRIVTCGLPSCVRQAKEWPLP